MFEKGDIKVDDRFARFGGKSFAINKINSVEVRSETVPGNKGYIAWWLIAGTLAMVAYDQSSWILFAVAVGSTVIGWRAWRRRHPVTTYRLFLVTSSSEAQAFQTRDAGEITSLRDAIEGAMARSS